MWKAWTPCLTAYSTRRAAGREVGQVVLVDQRRHEQHRLGLHFRRDRVVLDQLHHRRAQDDRTGRRRDLLAELELARFGADRQAGRAADVVGEPLRAGHEAAAAAVDHGLPRRGVRPRPVGGRERLDQVDRDQPQPVVVGGVELGGVEQLVDRERQRGVTLRDALEDRVVLPGPVGVPAVASRGLDRRAAGRDLRGVARELSDRPHGTVRTARDADAELRGLTPRERAPDQAERAGQQRGIEVDAGLIGDPFRVLLGRSYRGWKFDQAFGSLHTWRQGVHPGATKRC